MRYLSLVLLAVLTLGLGPNAKADAMNENRTDSDIVLVDFDARMNARWFVINDTVMGGVSRSEMRYTDRGTGVFTGQLSLDNNGSCAYV